MLQSFHHSSGPLLDSLCYVHVPLVLRSPELHTVLQVCSLQCWVEGKDHLPWAAGSTLLNAAEDTTTAGSIHCWFVFNLVSTSIPMSFSAKLLYNWAIPSIYWCMVLFLPRCRTLCFPLLNFMMLLSGLFSSLYVCIPIYTCISVSFLHNILRSILQAANCNQNLSFTHISATPFRCFVTQGWLVTFINEFCMAVGKSWMGNC